jgi:integration host factor subunit alpha
MNKKQIVQAIHDKVGFSKRETATIVEKAIELMKSALMNDEPVLISSFGKFDVRERKAHKGRNPQTGEAITIPSRKVVTFRASRLLKERINEAHRERDTG